MTAHVGFRQWLVVHYPHLDADAIIQRALDGESLADAALLERWLHGLRRRAYVRMDDAAAGHVAAFARELADKLTRRQMIELRMKDVRKDGDTYLVGDVPLGPRAVETLRVMLRDRTRSTGVEPEQYLFAHDDGSPWTERQVKYAIDRASSAATAATRRPVPARTAKRSAA